MRTYRLFEPMEVTINYVLIQPPLRRIWFALVTLHVRKGLNLVFTNQWFKNYVLPQI